MIYSWELSEWPNFVLDRDSFRDACTRYVERVNFLAGAVHGLADTPRLELISYQMALEGSASSRIEGLDIKVSDIKKSVANNLRPDLGFRSVYDKRASNLANIVTDNHLDFPSPLTEAKLFDWHRQLVAHRSDLKQVGAYRNSTQNMQIVSGPIGRETVHYVAPPAKLVAQKMKRYLRWFNQSRTEMGASLDGPVRAGIAHLYFELIHPFEDGNGRIGRVIAEKALAQNLTYPLPFSISHIISANTSEYYTALQSANTTLTIDSWIHYFVQVCLEAVEHGLAVYKFTLRKVRYFQLFDKKLNPAQTKAIHHMWAAGPSGFQGGMTAKKYSRINRVSPATATRDLAYLTKIGALERHGGGRSTHYLLPVARKG